MSSESGFTPHNFVRRITGIGPPNRPTSESSDDIRGHFGLRLLHDPKNPFVELVFVHGVPGGSRKTWCYHDRPTSFWPKEWLPHESGFSNVRIHSFGYDTNLISRRDDNGAIDAVGQTLLDYIARSPQIRKSKTNLIVFVAHSLGGLVVKRALNDAKQSATYDNLFQRFHTIFFLATPHRGFEDPAMVLRILKAGASDYRSGNGQDIGPSFAPIADEINRSFRRICHPVRLCSFYETYESSSVSSFVVNREVATLDLSNEETFPLMADHFGMTRFPDTQNEAYQTLRNALAMTMEEISGELLDPEKVQDQMRLIGDHLSINENEEEEELNLLSVVDGSCQWLSEKPSFLQWRDSLAPTSTSHLGFGRPSSSAGLKGNFRTPSRIYWLFGPPGCGKSHLAAFTVHHLKQFGTCSFYFLKHTDRSKQSLGGLLRSIAYQMAAQDVTLRRALLSMPDEGTLTAENHDVRVLWKQLFVQKIFRDGFQKPQFWIIDALDEGIAGHELVKLFASIPPQLRLKIFITSRHDSRIERDLRGVPVTIANIEVEDTQGDIQLFLEEHRDFIHMDSAEVEVLIEKLVRKSRGSFLWTHLVLDRLQDAWDYKTIMKVVHEIPENMNDLYRRVVNEMASKPNNKLAKAILRWTVCASRLLTTAELQDAVQRDIDDTVSIMDKMIRDVCGQLVVIEKSGKVSLVHDTARDFLTSGTLKSDFAIDKVAAHGRIAEVCLKHLINGSLRVGQRGATRVSDRGMSPLHEYANLYFAEHVLKGPSPESNTIDHLVGFLNSRILYTVEYIAKKRDLHYLTQIAKSLDAWIDRRKDIALPTSEMKFVQEWATDLIRLVTVFGKHILSDPSCIHTTIPPLCPKKSQIYRRYGNQSLSLDVVGLTDKTWNDRVFNSTFHDESTKSITCSGKHYIVGLRNGIAVAYEASTCQERSRLNIGTQIKLLETSMLYDWLLVSGSKRLSLWDYVNQEAMWSVETATEAMAMGFAKDDTEIVVTTRDNHIVTYSTRDGSVISDELWQSTARPGQSRPPMRVFMCCEAGLVAVVYRGEPLWLLELSNLARPRYFGRQVTVDAVAFNTALKMMAVAVSDGELLTVNLSALDVDATVSKYAEHLVVSGDGKTLCVGGKNGDISIHDFETLSELYTIRYAEEYITSLTMTSNGLRILDVRRKEFNVWEPSALYRRKDSEDSGSQGRTSFGTAVTEQYGAATGTDHPQINVVAVHDSGMFIFCGKVNGSVAVYDARSSKPMKNLYTHQPMGVTYVEWNRAQELLISADDSSRIKVHRIERRQVRTEVGLKLEWRVTMLSEHRVRMPIKQLQSSIDGEYLMVCDLHSDTLWTMKGEKKFEVRCRESEHPEHAKVLSQKWTIHPGHKRRMYEITNHSVQYVTWEDDHANPKQKDIKVHAVDRVDFKTRDSGIHFVKFDEGRTGWVTWAAFDDNPNTRPIIWETSFVGEHDHPTSACLDCFNRVAPEVQYLIGIHKLRLVFLNQEEWVCSISLTQHGNIGRIDTRHFPVPHCWQTSDRSVIASITTEGHIVFARSGELAVVQGWLNV